MKVKPSITLPNTKSQQQKMQIAFIYKAIKLVEVSAHTSPEVLDNSKGTIN
ncbi:protein of unknown function [Shewanella benthica]|uniref:Uncharacterized protein n=1 Tax=Shewanella benthica TaxID=43661 RepID=A0A330LYF5_9GAMM|nr:protein of unknown function [Shewanella benthica]